jgi:hypothetical protein
MAAEIRDMHVPGDLEIWVRRQIIQPGATVPLVGRVKMNSRTIGKQVGSAAELGGEVVVQFAALVGREHSTRVLTTLSGVTAITAGTAFWITGNWLIGLLVALFGLTTTVSVWLFSRSR